MRKREKKWLKYKLESCWIAYTRCQNSYYGKLNCKKKEVLKNKFAECNKDSKKIHALVTNLTCKQQPQQWPPHKSEADLAEEFAAFFLDKINKIHEALRDKPVYIPTPSDAPKPRKFASLTEAKVYKVIMSLKSKSYKLDPIPTTVFKQLLPATLPLITKIVNLSLTEGQFIRSWKTAIVWPLLKKLGLQLIKSNFRAVSNLSFFSKITEQCMLLQLSDQCDTYGLQLDYQSAYREHYSCETAVLKLSNDIL